MTYIKNPRGHVVFDCDGTLIGFNGNSQALLFPEIKELIIKLTELNYQLYVWTYRERQSTLSILKDLDIASNFLEFSCYEDTIPKPHPSGLEAIVGEYPRKNIVMIGDSAGDIKGAKSFGCQSIAACWRDPALERYLAQYGPSALAKSPEDCEKLIAKLIG